MYQTPFNLVLPDDRASYRTLCGSIMSMLTVYVILLFAVYKIVNLVSL